MKPVIDFLKANPSTQFATSDNNTPKVRPILFPFDENGVLWFCTAKNKNFWKELNANPKVEFSSFDGVAKWIRVSGNVKLIDNIDVKKKILELYPTIKEIYIEPTNPIFASFCLEHWTATIYSFTDPPVQYEF
ncbi:MAG: pyridoxamine 5'-phosphate oxidase family protein [Planctomycetaceae bacterium]|jgi:uncharacterized pyridoxamine 5'-phosphate oxidase family protein|nr:pyridoxamine 5'-phosphate oxidase family protein [Planctomycetaceae bacterium]